MTIKRLEIGVVAAAWLVVMPALAAQPMPVTVSPSWTGLYLDGDIGWEQTSNRWDYNASTLPGLSPFSISSNDGVLGGHIGYQQQFNWLVIGGEFGGSATFSNHFATSIPTAVPGGPPCTFGTGVQCQTAVGSAMTIGGKMGLAWQDWLVYGTGGAAFDGSVTSRAIFAGSSIETSTAAKANGYYVGGGIDYMLTETNFGDLIVGVEYEHIDLGNVQLFSSSNGFAACAPGPNCAERTIGTREDIVWGKVTLKFNPIAQ